eukprot:TRINITY_DN2197_c0_g3_i1.p1 TRINITY_DN2197_c0_g3~~TRINITY_DN2197_c0_g3_i1.p1  ORF type:complete len:346 (+),score=94.39 TRINITY_DN2197_c0_g3_i1:133-1170(+)
MEDSTGDKQTLSFQKRSGNGGARRRPQQLRKKPQPSGGATSTADGDSSVAQPVHEEEEEPTTPLGLLLRETRAAQRDRERSRGTPAIATDTTVLALISEKGGGHAQVEDTEGSSSEKGGVEGGLTSAFVVQKEETGPVNPLLEAYIQKGLKDYRDQKAQEQHHPAKNTYGDEEEEEETPETRLREVEKQLYTIPDEWKGKKPTAEQEGGVSEAWLTGIQEVELPVEYKLRNIEDTEAAKKTLRSNRPSSAQAAEHAQQRDADTRFHKLTGETQIVRSGANSTAGGRDHAENTQPATSGGSRGGGSSSSSSSSSGAGGGRGAKRPGPANKASDDAAFERFKKKWRY